MLIAVPLISILGSPVLWALLPFLAVTVWALWFALRKNGRGAASKDSETPA